MCLCVCKDVLLERVYRALVCRSSAVTCSRGVPTGTKSDNRRSKREFSLCTIGFDCIRYTVLDCEPSEVLASEL